MKRIYYFFTVALLLISFGTGCTGVDSGHKGVEVGWGGETNLTKVYPEGLQWGFHWLWDEMVEYDVRERTYSEKFEFNDRNNMATMVEIALDYNYDPNMVNRLHVEISDIQAKILKTLKSAGKEVVPQYTASELNLLKRTEAEAKLSKILSAELPEFYVEFARVQLTDVDIPETIANAAQATATQIERNKLAKEKAQEAENNFLAAEWDAKTKKILSQPAMLQLKELELQEKWIQKWNGSFGNNNVFGSDVSVLKGQLN